ncbi:MAG: hypothetical protein ABFE01_07930 [Phycisphaerales bacterium]
MDSRTTKLTAAILVLAAVVLGARYFNGTTVKAVEFSEIVEAMNKIPWMHGSAASKGSNAPGAIELWIGFDTQVQGYKMPYGRVSFYRLKEHEKAEYDPGSNTITFSPAQESDLPAQLTSPMQMLESMHRMLKDQGAEVKVRMGDYQGRRVQVQEISLTMADKGMNRYALKLYVDPQSKLLCGGEATASGADGVVISTAEISYDYPQTGPGDIYDLGVPRDAKVVNDALANEFQALWKQYREVRAEAANQYIAIITHADRKGIITRLDVDYRSDRKHRMERHSVFHNGEMVDQLWPQYKEQLGDSFESLLSWAHNHYDDSQGTLAVYLYDGECYGSTIRSGVNGWRERVRLRTSADPSPLESLADLAWPRIASTARIIEDDYARRNGLTCIESLSQGRMTRDGWPSLPARFLYYLDPAWDYMCRRQVTERRPDADWQQDKEWLAGVDPNKTRDGSVAVQEITEAFEAPNGRWYPVVIVEQSTGDRKDYREAPLATGTTKRIYLDLAPKFPAGVFDIDKLPGQ